MNRGLVFNTLLSLLCLMCFETAAADEVAYFRRDGGVAAAENRPLPAKFDSEGGHLWRREIAPGNSTPCVIGDRIYLTTFLREKKELATLALDRSSGKILWKRVVPTVTIEVYHPVSSPASATPASDGERVYSFFGSYGFLCYDRDGEVVWSKRLGPFQDEYGASSSPILVDGKIILNEDHDIDNYLIAIDKLTGKTVWKVPRRGFTRSYSTPIVWEIAGEKQLIVAGSLQLTAYNISSGKEIWRVRGLSRIVDTTPVIADGLLYLATWTSGGDPGSRIAMEPFSEALKSYDKNGNGKIDEKELPKGAVLSRFFRIDLNQDQGLDEAEWNKHSRVFDLAHNVAIAVRPGGKGDVTGTHVEWTYGRGLPVCPSPLVHDGVLYMIKDSGILTTLDAKTGQRLKQGRLPGRGNYYASPITGDGKVYTASERGVVTILEAGRKWSILSKHDFGERITATPVIADGKIYLRTDAALYCFGER